MGFIKDLKEGFINGYKLRTRKRPIVPKLGQINVNNKCTVILLDPVLVKGTGRIFAVCSMEPERNVISVDDNFINLSDNAKNFILLHEQGHIINNLRSQSGIKVLLKEVFNKVDTIEIEADKYAISNIGKDCVLKAIDELLQISQNNKGLKLRYNYIKNNL